MKKRVRLGLSILIVLLTIGVFTYYLSHHQAVLTQLAHTPPSLIIWLLLLYVVWLVVLLLILWASLRLCRLILGRQENLILNAYSLMVNYFMPGQGGPAMRGIYLKRRHKLPIRNYVTVTLLYYLFYGVISVYLLLAGSRPWWQTLLATAGITVVGFLTFRLHTRRQQARNGGLDFSPSGLLCLLGVTVAQAIVQVIIYGVELHSVNSHIVLRQMVTYTGAANLALFVGLTPGAIGIRESFLIFSERLHHISSANIVAANVIDRAVYLLFLCIILVLTLVFHTKEKLRASKQRRTNKLDE
jgi:uncharacterized membrane protein YbhN (UPF0104 family)